MGHRMNKQNRNKRVVLGEDAYLDNLQKIIGRDYYPDIALLQEDLSRLHGCSKHDISSTSAAPIRKATGTWTGKGTGVGEEADKETETLREVADIGTLGLSEFFAKYTSEDNASFEKLLAADEDARKTRFHWTHPINNKNNSNCNSSSSCSSKTSVHPQLDDTPELYREGMLMLYYLKGGKVLNVQERREMDLILSKKDVNNPPSAKRYGILTTPKFQVRNAFFFPPDACHSSSTVPAIKDVSASSSSSSSSSSTSSFSAKNMKKGIVSANTRLLSDSASSDSAVPKLINSLQEKPHSPSVCSTSDSEAMYGGIEKYPLLDMSPTPSTIRFELRSPSLREELAHSLADGNVRRKNKAKKILRSAKLSVTSSSMNIGQNTSNSSARNADGFATALKKCYKK